MLQTVSVWAPPGAEGPGGNGGPAGNPGGGGSGGKHKADGPTGGGASGGATGATAGRQDPGRAWPDHRYLYLSRSMASLAALNPAAASAPRAERQTPGAAAGQEGPDQALRRLAAPLPSRQAWPMGISLALVPSFEEARRLLGPAEPGGRPARNELSGPRPRFAPDRGSCSACTIDSKRICSPTERCARGRRGHRRHLPLHLKTVHLDALELGRGETPDLSATAEDWPGLHIREELYLWVRIGTLRLAPGSRLIVRGNVCAIELDIVQFTGPADTAAAEWPEISILGTPHAPFSRFRWQARSPADPARPETTAPTARRRATRRRSSDRARPDLPRRRARTARPGATVVTAIPARMAACKCSPTSASVVSRHSDRRNCASSASPATARPAVPAARAARADRAGPGATASRMPDNL